MQQQWQHSRNTCIWRIYPSVDTIFHRLCFISGFPWHKAIANEKASGKLEVINTTNLRSATKCLCHRWPQVCPVCFSQFRIIPRSWLITEYDLSPDYECAKDDGCHYLIRNSLPLRSTWVHHRYVVDWMLLDRQFFA